MENTQAHQQMNLINEMIESTRQGIRENGFQYLLWGWLVFIASIGEYALIQMDYSYPFVTWFLMPLGGIISWVASRREDKQAGHVRTWVDRMMKYIWIAFGVCLFIVLASMQMLQISTIPMVLMVYGVGTFISGGALAYRPLIFGGITCWILSVCAFFVTVPQQMLLLALAVLVAYIVPGHLLKRRSANVR
jgi:FtsH-binding integral membrane protein